MPDLRQLYQQVILDHNRSPRNFRKLVGANHSAEGNNPLCGDIITVQVCVDDNRITDVAFQGSGCAISQASASLMTESVKGKTQEEATALFQAFHEMVTSPQEAEPPASLGKLIAFSGVRQFPTRVKCANLPWHTLRAALKAAGQTVSTE